MTSFEQFTVRFYNWASSDLEREMRSGFPLLMGIPDLATRRFIQHLTGLSSHAKACLAAGLVKRFHVNAVHLLNDPITNAEAAAIKGYLDSDISICEIPRHVPRRGIQQLLEDEFLNQLPGVKVEWDRSTGVAVTRVGLVIIETTLDLESSADRLAYKHRIISRGGSFDLISVLSWMGIAFGTTWSEASDARQIVPGFRAVYMHFMDALPGLLGNE